MQTAAARVQIVASAQQQKAAPKATVAALPRVAKALGAGVASLALALSANAATVKREFACSALQRAAMRSQERALASLRTPVRGRAHATTPSQRSRSGAS